MQKTIQVSVLLYIGLFLGLQSQAMVLVESIDLATGPAPQEVRTAAASSVTGGSLVRVVVDMDHPGQVMDGIGGAFNELGWEALRALPESRRTEILRALFDIKAGAALRFNRIPIGASDFAASAYSLDDTTDDRDLAHFTIQRDEGCLIPYIKAAQAVNPAMKFHASPWSPPGWMKTNGSQTGGGQLKDDDLTLQAHAGYLVKFLKAYAAHGITVNRLCPQNEPLVAGNYPGCLIPAPLYARAVTQWVAPAVRASGLAAEVWAGTFNYWREDTGDHFMGILGDAGLARAIGGISFQYSHIPWVQEYHAKYPDVPMQFSESQCYDGGNTVAEAMRDFQDFAAYTRAGCQLFTFWNMLLPEPRNSTWGWRQNSLVVIDKQKQTVAYQPSYALARFLGREIAPGERYLPATVTTGDAGIGAIEIPGDRRGGLYANRTGQGESGGRLHTSGAGAVVLVLNQGPETRVQLKTGQGTQDAILPGASLCALVAN